MANSLLTDIKITRKSLAILHNKSTFIGTIGRQYDDQFSNENAKIGNQLKIRLPNQYNFRRGPVANMQSTQETNVVLVLASIGGADMDFSDTDLSLDIENFAERILDPAVSMIIANIEADAFSMVNQVYQFVGTPGVTPTGIGSFLNAKTLLNQSLTPKGNGRKVQTDSVTSAAMANGMTNFLLPTKEISEQFLEGSMGRASNFDFYENELVPIHTTGTMAGSGNAAVNGPNQTGSVLNLSGFTAGATLTPGTVFTLAGTNKVHPETKQNYGSLQQFTLLMDNNSLGVYTADANGNVTVNISPSIIPVVAAPAIQNPYANVSASPTSGVAGSVVFPEAASTSYGRNIAYHKDAFTFVTGDMTLPKGMDMCYREVSEGISLRILRGFDIINNVYLSRLDILYGYLAARPQLACIVTR